MKLNPEMLVLLGARIDRVMAMSDEELWCSRWDDKIDDEAEILLP